MDPEEDQIVRRMTVDLTNSRILQDLKDFKGADAERGSASESGLRSSRWRRVFYYVHEGKQWHRHIPLMGGKAKQCEIYADGLLKSIMKGLRNQLKKVRPMSSMSFGPTNEEVDLDLTLVEEDWETFVDEVSGKPLETSGVIKAREEEIEFAVRYNVWTPASLDECYKETGKPPVSCRWIDINKGDVKKPNYRSRLVVQEIRQSSVEAIFAATPPLESVRILLSMQRTGNQVDAKGRRKKVMFIDVRRAHWCAKIFRLVYVRLPPEAGLREDQCGRLNKAMYGCTDAASCWELEITDFFTTCGFAPGIASPVLFVNTLHDIQVSIHGDDITALGFEDDLFWLKARIEERYEIKYGGMLGPGANDVRNVVRLNRLIHYADGFTTIEADPRHVQIVLDALNLHQAKPVGTPGVQKVSPDTTPLSEADVKRYRSLAMRINYLALDRPDVAYSSKELARGMQSPNVGHWSGLKRMARYLLGCPRMVWRYDDQDECGTLTMYTDSDDAGCLQTRKSTSCGEGMAERSTSIGAICGCSREFMKAISP